MAKEPDNLVLKLLREMRDGQKKMQAVLDKHSEEFKKLHREILEWKQTSAAAGGYAIHANVQAGELQSKIDRIEKRLKRLEERV